VAKVETWATAIFDLGLFILVRAVFVDMTLEDFHERSYGASMPPLPPGRIKSDHAHFIFEQERLADQHTDDKVRQLLTVTSALAALVSTIALSKFGVAIHGVVLIGLPLLPAVYICVGGLLGIRVHSLPTVSEAGADPNDQEWARGLITATGFNRGSRLFRVDLYRAALRWFLLALLLVPFVLAFRALIGVSIAGGHPSVM
jgi:hypothetical protein